MNRQETLEEALKIVTKDRQNAYGTPEDNFTRIAGLWSAYLGHTITAQQVAVLMILLKVARSKTSPDYVDNYVDIAGYAACANELGGKKCSTDQSLQITYADMKAYEPVLT